MRLVEAPNLNEEVWREAVAAGSEAQEIWLGEVPAAWPGPPLPPEARVLFTARAFTPSGYRMAVAFILAPEALPALQQTFAQAGWLPPHLDLNLPQPAPGLMLLELAPHGLSTGATVDLLLLWVRGRPNLWGEMSLFVEGRDTSDALHPPLLPWNLPMPAGWQGEEALREIRAPDGRLRGYIGLVSLGQTDLEAAFADWQNALQGEGWRPLEQGSADRIRWASWARGESRRILAVVPQPWREDMAAVVGYAWATGPSPAKEPIWHGELPAEAWRQAALLALTFFDIQFQSPLTLTFGSLPPGDWPLADQAVVTFGRQSENGSQGWLIFQSPAEQVASALREGGWQWHTLDRQQLAPGLLGAPWPEFSSPGAPQALQDALCRGDQGGAARLWPRGVLALRLMSNFCPTPTDDLAAKVEGWLPAPAGYPLAAFGAMKTAYVGYNTGDTFSLAVFGLSDPPTAGEAWLDAASRAFQSHQWEAKPGAHTLLARSPLGEGDLEAFLFVLPVSERYTFFGILGNR